MKIHKIEDYIKPENWWEWNCPFCNIEKEYLLWTGKFFSILVNKFSYTWDDRHLLVVPNKHLEHTFDLPAEEFMEFKIIEKFMDDYFDDSYFSFIREKWKFKSIKHFHYHFLAGEIWEELIIKELNNNK